jgi:hypothetical protein
LSLFCLWDRVSITLPGWPQTCDPPASASWIARNTDMYPHTWLNL